MSLIPFDEFERELDEHADVSVVVLTRLAVRDVHRRDGPVPHENPRRDIR